MFFWCVQVVVCIVGVLNFCVVRGIGLGCLNRLWFTDSINGAKIITTLYVGIHVHQHWHWKLTSKIMISKKNTCVETVRQNLHMKVFS